MMKKSWLLLFGFLAFCRWEPAESNGTAVNEVKQGPKATGVDSGVLPFGEFLPELENNIKAGTPAGSRIQKASLEVLSGPVKQGQIRLSAGQTFTEPGKTGEFQFEPVSKGEIVSSGVRWEWNLKVRSRGDQTCLDATPAFFRFKCKVYFTIESDLPGDEGFFQVIGTKDRWFYIVAGAGKNQDATIVPKNAPKDDKASQEDKK